MLLEFCFYFKITLKNKLELFLCSGPEKKLIENQLYFPYSGLSIEEAYFDNFTSDEIFVHGVYENYGIERSLDLVDSKFEIFTYDKCLKYYAVVYCTNIYNDDLEFKLKLEPKSKNYSRPLLQIFSKTCRADLGDDRCKVDLDKYSSVGSLEEIIDFDLILVKISRDIDDYYYNNGRCVVGNNSIISANYVIVENSFEKHEMQKIKILGRLSDNFNIGSSVTLFPNCDKTFITCCKKFNNALNFRGEPMIPNFDVLRN